MPESDHLLDRVSEESKIAPNSLMSEAMQVQLYRENRGYEAAMRQVRDARLVRGACVCVPVKLKRRWEGSDKLTLRTVHKPDCPRFKPWMAL